MLGSRSKGLGSRFKLICRRATEIEPWPSIRPANKGCFCPVNDNQSDEKIKLITLPLPKILVVLIFDTSHHAGRITIGV